MIVLTNWFSNKDLSKDKDFQNGGTNIYVTTVLSFQILNCMENYWSRFFLFNYFK